MMDAPAWRKEPNAPGLWIRQRWWKDKRDPELYDGPHVFEVVLTGDGFRFVGNGKLFPFENYGADSNSVASFYGPIPLAKKPERS